MRHSEIPTNYSIIIVGALILKTSEWYQYVIRIYFVSYRGSLSGNLDCLIEYGPTLETTPCIGYS